jgi:hypothetical protein
MSKRFRRTPEEIAAGVTIEEAKAARELQLPTTEELQEFTDDFITQATLNKKHEENPTIEVVTGAGDIVEKITKATGIKAVVDYFTPDGEDCGCDERKKKLNKIPVLKNKVHIECLTVEEYNFMNPLLSNRLPISGKDVNKLIEIYSRIFNVKVVSSCNGCSMSKKLDELKAVLRTYE